VETTKPSEPRFSKDGQWVAYASFPDGTLWKSRADGSQRLQLSYPPLTAVLPRRVGGFQTLVRLLTFEVPFFLRRVTWRWHTACQLFAPKV
jgi:hypothetical protein